jgi:hypothetical protein
MSKRLALIAVLFAGCLFLCACGLSFARGSGKLVTESREVRGFDHISLTSSGEVILVQGDRESLTVETDDNLMQHVKTEVQGDTLTLGTKGGVAISPTKLIFSLTVRDLDGLTATGSGEIVVERFNTDNLEIKTTGSGDIRIDALAADEISVRITGSGDVYLAGQVAGQEVSLSGSGVYRAGDLRSETAAVRTTGSGGATAWVTESLDARTTGSGSIEYYGAPKVDASSTGSGRVRGLGGK